MGLFDFFGGGRKGGGISTIPAPKYQGARPYSAGEVGLGADQLSPLSQQFIDQIMRRSRGEGLVGFDPNRRALLKNEFTQDLTQAQDEARRRLQAQAASQGLRGGIPLDISRRSDQDFSRARESGLAKIDIADLEANRADRNRATELQPQTVELGSGIQRNRAMFDLAVNQFEQPTYLVDQAGSGGSDLAGALGQLFGANRSTGGGGFDLSSIFGGGNQTGNRSFGGQGGIPLSGYRDDGSRILTTGNQQFVPRGKGNLY